MKLLLIISAVLLSTQGVAANTGVVRVSPTQITSAAQSVFAYSNPRSVDYGDWDFYVQLKVTVRVDFRAADGSSDFLLKSRKRSSSRIGVPKDAVRTQFSESHDLTFDIGKFTADLRRSHADLEIESISVVQMSLWIYESISPQASTALLAPEIRELYEDGVATRIIHNYHPRGENFSVELTYTD